LSQDWFNVAKIVNTHGVRGELKLIAQTDFPEERFKPGSRLTLVNPETMNMANAPEFEVATSRFQKNSYIVKFKEIEDINQALKYKGWQLKVSSEQLFELPKGEYYYFEIIGCAVATEEGEHLGQITEILSPGANDVWVVQPPQGKPIYIPYIDDVVKQVDIGNKKIIIHLLEGLV